MNGSGQTSPGCIFKPRARIPLNEVATKTKDVSSQSRPTMIFLGTWRGRSISAEDRRNESLDRLKGMCMKAIMFRFPRAGREGDIPAAPIR